MAKRVSHEAKIDFVVPGVQKGGTRALGHFLSQNPDIGLSKKAEVHFFDDAAKFRGTPDYDVYHSRFDASSLDKITGDITPIYLYWKDALPRIREYNPRMKFIVLLRNPIERAYSQWAMQIATGKETEQFYNALLKEPHRRGFNRQHRVFSYVHRGFYSSQLERLFSLFPRQQCLVLKSEELRDRHRDTLRQVHDFLGVGGAPIPSYEAVNSRKYEPMPLAARKVLALVFDQEIDRLEYLLEWDCSSWRT